MSRPVDYAPGKLLDVYAPGAIDVPGAPGALGGAAGVPVVLLWHGSGVDERDVLAPLAAEVAAHGLLVLVPDWQSDDPGAGSTHLRASLSFARSAAAGMGGDPGRVVLAGWSLGANAAAWVALHPGAFDGWAPVALVGLAGSYDESPFGGDVIAEAGHDGAGRRAVLVHGTRDTVVPPVRSVTTADHLAGLGWMAGLRMLETDHAGIVGTEYDPWRRRCVPTADTARIATRAAVASLVAEAAFGTSE